MSESSGRASAEDIRLMRLALAQAKKGLGRTSPNPCVGAVIVQDDGVIVGRGYHKKAGTPHAEIHALADAGGRARGCTIYVTLEPCNHTGRTPPCSHAVANAGIRRVVVGLEDPNPLVSGSGICYLRQRGLEVCCGVLEKECRELNLPFIKHIGSGRPFVVLKAGISLDGRLSYQEGISGQMTGAKSHHHLHQLRDQHDAILVGRGTVQADNPSLTTRLKKGGRDPLRVILDSSLAISCDAKILHLNSTAHTLIFCCHRASSKKRALLEAMEGVAVHGVARSESGPLDLVEILDHLGEMGVCSLLVEGGGQVHASFLEKALVDRVILFVAPLFAGSAGTPLLEGFSVIGAADAPRLRNVLYRRCGDDLLVQGDLVRI